MVAYSFKPQFVPAIANGTKLQTIRAHRRRHAMPGECLQLYTSMRTRACRLIRNDAVCTRVDDFVMDLSPLATHERQTTASAIHRLVYSQTLPVLINDEPVNGADRDRLAVADGFTFWTWKGETLEPWPAMVMFWLSKHGPALFRGRLIRWQVP
jgi:hypothetical protein